jgi:hypothetical protein
VADTLTAAGKEFAVAPNQPLQRTRGPSRLSGVQRLTGGRCRGAGTSEMVI